LVYRVYLIINKLLQIIAGIILIGLILLVCGNIFFRVFLFPIRGTFELVGLLGAVMCGFSLAYTQDQGANIAVDILFKHFSKSIRKALSIINHFVCIFLFSIGTWKLVLWAIDISKSGEVTETLRIIYYPFILCVAFGFFLLVISFMLSLFMLFKSTDLDY